MSPSKTAMILDQNYLYFQIKNPSDSPFISTQFNIHTKEKKENMEKN